MKNLFKFVSVALAATLTSMCFLLIGCGKEKRYNLTVNGGEYLYSKLNDSYKAGEIVSVKVKIKPYEGVKALLDTKALVKAKSEQDDYWLFTFEMPSHDANLDITSFNGFNEPILHGFYLTFKDKNGEPIEQLNKDIKDENVVADYFITYYSEEIGNKVYTHNTGAGVFAGSKSSIGNTKIELEDTLYFTYELLDAVAVAEFVYYDEKTQDIYSYGNPVGIKLDDIGYSSLFENQNLSDIRFNAQMKEYEEKFESHVTLHMEYLDYLTGVKVLEFDANNQLIESVNIIETETEKTHIASENCEYVIIEEEYTVKNDEDRNGETYYERTLINKSQFGDGKLLKYPRGDGLISPIYLSVKWQIDQ